MQRIILKIIENVNVGNKAEKLDNSFRLVIIISGAILRLNSY